MSEEILRNPKSNYQKSMDASKHQNLTKGLTKIQNPLVRNTFSKNTHLIHNRLSSAFYQITNSKAQSQMTLKHQNLQNNKQNPIKCFLKNPQFKFNEIDFNLSSESSVLHVSFRDSRKQIEKSIAKKFQHSENQIKNLLLQNPAYKRTQTKQHEEKKAKLQFYRCDSIIIKPILLTQPVKVIDLVIHPTKVNEKQNNNFNNQQAYLQKKLAYESHCKNHFKDFSGSFDQSPLESKQNFQIDHINEPSFLKNFQQSKENSNLFTAQNQTANNYQIIQKQKLNLKLQNIERNCNTSNQSQKCNSLKNWSFKKEQKETSKGKFDACQFKRRNRIFTNDKKNGLKLSRAIRHQIQLDKLEGELGVDVFHIVIEEDQFLRQCCT